MAKQIYEAGLIDGSAAWHRDCGTMPYKDSLAVGVSSTTPKDSLRQKSHINFHLFSYLTYSVEYRQHNIFTYMSAEWQNMYIIKLANLSICA